MDSVIFADCLLLKWSSINNRGTSKELNFHLEKEINSSLNSVNVKWHFHESPPCWLNVYQQFINLFWIPIINNGKRYYYILWWTENNIGIVIIFSTCKAASSIKPRQLSGIFVKIKQTGMLERHAKLTKEIDRVKIRVPIHCFFHENEYKFLLCHQYSSKSFLPKVRVCVSPVRPISIFLGIVFRSTDPSANIILSVSTNIKVCI